MIREYRQSDIDQIIDVWLSASIAAHDFIEPAFWAEPLGDMRSLYIPASETFVFDDEGKIAGFYSLTDNTLAALLSMAVVEFGRP